MPRAGVRLGIREEERVWGAGDDFAFGRAELEGKRPTRDWMCGLSVGRCGAGVSEGAHHIGRLFRCAAACGAACEC